MKTLACTCATGTNLPYKTIREFQGDLKYRTQDDIDHLVYSIETYGFSFPFFIWRRPDGECMCLDGHGRLLALAQLEKEGYVIPELPVVYIDVDSEDKAWEELLRINTVTGAYSEDGFVNLVKDLPSINIMEYSFPTLDLEKLQVELQTLQLADKSICSLGAPVSGLDLGESPTMHVSQDFSGTAVPAPAKPISVDGSPTPLIKDTTLMMVDESTNANFTETVVCCPDCSTRFIYRCDK